MKKVSLLIFLLLLIEFASADTVLLQEGADGYSGCQDSYISTDQPNNNYGLTNLLYLNRNNRATDLIRFDLSSIPSNSQITNATLYLYQTTSTTNPRRIKLNRILKNWDEGNKNGAVISSAGDHGVTANKSFDYYTGEGADISWSTLGMSEGNDYSLTKESIVDIAGIGIYAWNVTESVTYFVRNSANNFGFRISDDQGYVSGVLDYRNFVSCEGNTISQRPMLVIEYNPSAPLANAGQDIELFNWITGSAISLDGSGSSGSSLTYSWSFIKKAYGSQLSDSSITPNNNPSATRPTFTPDKAGEYTIRLTVTNSLGYTNSDEINLRILSMNSHPRIYLTPERLTALRSRMNSNTPEWQRLKSYADGGGSSDLLSLALVYQITQQQSYGTQAVNVLMNSLQGVYNVESASIGFDWLYNILDASQKQQVIDYLNTRYDATKNADLLPFNNYNAGKLLDIGISGLATYGDNPRAKELIDHARYIRYRDFTLGSLEICGEGGGWSEGSGYDFSAMRTMRYADGVYTATGEDLFESHIWFKDYLKYRLFQDYPKSKIIYGQSYFDTPAIGDMERNRYSFSGYRRLMSEILVNKFPALPEAQNLQWLLSQSPVNKMPSSFLYWAEMIYYNPSQSSVKPSALSHFARGVGQVFMRSDWDSQDATHIMFKAGDHFTYHQDICQNSFTIFKYDDLAIKSGVYDSYGDTSPNSHLLAYNSRTIASNSLLIYQPGEVFDGYRSGTTVPNDGGQTTNFGGSVSPSSKEAWLNTPGYNTADIIKYEDRGDYVYTVGDATKAYKASKISAFIREFLYLRPSAGKEVVIVFDKVNATNPTYSKKWLLHFINEPSVDGTKNNIDLGEEVFTGASVTSADSGTGRLFVKSLLPEGLQIRKVGGRIKGGVSSFTSNSLTDNSANYVVNSLIGNTLSFTSRYNSFNRQYPIISNTANTITVDTSGLSDFNTIGVTNGDAYSAGKDYWVFGKNYPATQTDFEADYGSYRIEVEPTVNEAYTNFLNVLYPSSTSVLQIPNTALINDYTGKMQGALIDDSIAVMFARGLSASNQAQYTLNSTGTIANLIVDLNPNTIYHIYNNGNLLRTMTSSSEGTLYFDVSTSSENTIRISESTTQYHASDLNMNGIIEINEIVSYIRQFKSGSITRANTLIAVSNFLKGNYQ